MSWETYKFDKISKCACSNGQVVKHCYEESDDWNRFRSGHYGIDIECNVCASKYHI